MVIFRFTGVAALALALAASPAWAESAEAEPASLTLVQPEALPLSEADLRRALLARLPPPPGDSGQAGLPHVEVEPAGVGAVTVRVGPRSRVVEVGDRSGAEAARVVALVVAELVGADAETGDASDTPAAPSVTVVGAPPLAPSATVVDIVVPPRAATPRTHRLCLTAGLARGTGDDEPVTRTLDLDLAMALGDGRLRFAPSLGLTLMPTRHAETTDQVSFTGGVARALGGASFGHVDLLAGPVVSPYGIGGAASHSGVLFGGEAVVRLTIPLRSRLRLVGAVRADAFADRVRVLFADGGTYATPRLQIGVAVGVAWDWTP
jgi:hypothetical protein